MIVRIVLTRLLTLNFYTGLIIPDKIPTLKCLVAGEFYNEVFIKGLHCSYVDQHCENYTHQVVDTKF